MDKNTLTGLLLMGCVIFGFMFLTRNPEGTAEAEKAAAALQEQTMEQNHANALAPDSLSAAEIASIAPTIEMAGARDDSGTVTFTTDGSTLTLQPDGTLDGRIAAADTTVALQRLISGNFNGLTLDRSKAALASLRAILDKGSRFRSFARYLSGNPDETVVLANDLLTLEIASKGGCIARATLNDYDTYINDDTARVEVIRPGDADFNFSFTSATQQRFDTRDFYFRPIIESDTSVVMQLELGNGATWGIRYSLAPQSYVVRQQIVQHNMHDIIPPSTVAIDFEFAQNMARNEIGRTYEERNSALTYKQIGDSPSEFDNHKDVSRELNEPVKWIAFKNQFFSAVWIAADKFNDAQLSQTIITDRPAYLKHMVARTTLDYSAKSDTAATMDIFIGPNLYPLLSGLDNQIAAGESLDMTRLIPLGWPLFRWINTLIIIPVFTFLGSFISNYGLIIFLLTIFIKIIIFPFTYKSFMSQAKMRVLAPEIKEINEKYPGQENAMTRNQKTMELYSKAGASPFSGCLPMLLQMPVLIAMFWFFPSCIELRGESFLWAKNLAAPDFVLTLPFSIPFYGNKVALFCLLMTAVNVIYTRINMQNQPGGQSMPGMKWMMYLMPVMFLFFFNDYASGLSYYYFLSLLITIIQTYIFRRCVDEGKVRRRMMENAKKPRKKSGLMARLEAAQREQQKAMREAARKR